MGGLLWDSTPLLSSHIPCVTGDVVGVLSWDSAWEPSLKSSMGPARDPAWTPSWVAAPARFWTLTWDAA